MDIAELERQEKELTLIRLDPVNGALTLVGIRPNGVLSIKEAEVVADQLTRAVAILRKLPQPVPTPEHWR